MVETGKQSDWKEEQNRKDFPWGWPAREHKSLIDPITTVADGTGKSTSYVFTYDNVKKANSILEHNAIDEETGQKYHTQLFASFPYRPIENSTYVKDLTAKQLEDMNFGLKQKGPMCFNNKDGQASYTISDHVDGKDAFGDFKDDEEKKGKDSSIHRMALNKTSVNSVSNKLKRGLGPKFFNRGANACINAIVTRYDRYGNVQMMAMLRPQDADSDPGDYQMSAGCIFFAQDMKFNEIEIKGMTSTPYNLKRGSDGIPEDEGSTKEGKLVGRNLAYARASIYGKLLHGEEYIPIIESWDFDAVLGGIVDDVSNTAESWVETHYNVHHITGHEEEEELSMLENAKVNKKRANVGFGVWRSIDPDPKDSNNVYSQLYVKDEESGGLEGFSSHYAKHDESSQKYDAFAEFDMWHGEHAFVARMISDYVKKKYKFEGPANNHRNSKDEVFLSPFGKCHIRSNSIEENNTLEKPV